MCDLNILGTRIEDLVLSSRNRGVTFAMPWSAMVEEVEEATSLSGPAALWEPDAATLEIWSASLVMVEWKMVRCGAVSSEWKIEGFERRIEKRWDLVCTVASNFTWVVGDSVTIHFLMKRFLSISSTRVIWLQDWGAEKIGSLKDFEIHSVQEKELPINRSTYINPISTVICPKQKKKIMQPLHIVRSNHSSKQSIDIIHHTESDQAITLWDPIRVRIKEDIHSVQVNIHHGPDQNKTTMVTALKLSTEWLMLSQWSHE
jgi:hypothetical protein